MNLSQWQPLANHLWQSTLFAVIAGLLTLALKKNRAQIRYWLWFAASVKFLVPFSILVVMAANFGRPAITVAAPFNLPAVIEQVSVPFSAPALHPPAAPQAFSPMTWIPPLLCIVWGAGFVGLVSLWWNRWRQVRKVLETATPLDLAVGIQVMSSETILEPGVFGIRRPVLLLPAGILSQLNAAQLDAILAHELCHFRRRDNLTAAIHMLVEALFWFYPLVWWMGARLMEERECACDEEVLRTGSIPEVYAEGILRVCELYLESPLECLPGVTGANLKRRIEAIMRNRVSQKVNFSQKLLVAFAALIAVAAPVVVGMLNISTILRAQSVQSARAFEVASVKPHQFGDANGSLPHFLPGGRFSAAGLPLQFVIAFAYNVPFQGTQLSGGPDWIRSDEGAYDIEAKADPEALNGLSPEDQETRLRLMVQELLRERFNLVIRRETKDQPVYVLTVGKSGPKFLRSKLSEKDCDAAPDSCHQGGAGQGRGIHVKAFRMGELVVLVSSFTDHPLIDRTGLTGLYDIDAEGWVPMRPRRPRPPGTEPSAEDLAFADPARPTLFMIFDKLGLKMESSKAAVDSLVIEHVEKPAAN